MHNDDTGFEGTSYHTRYCCTKVAHFTIKDNRYFTKYVMSLSSHKSTFSMVSCSFCQWNLIRKTFLNFKTSKELEKFPSWQFCVISWRHTVHFRSTVPSGWKLNIYVTPFRKKLKPPPQDHSWGPVGKESEVAMDATEIFVQLIL